MKLRVIKFIMPKETLEKFLRQEREATARIIKQKCLEHSKKCKACDILNRRMESQNMGQCKHRGMP